MRSIADLSRQRRGATNARRGAWPEWHSARPSSCSSQRRSARIAGRPRSRGRQTSQTWPRVGTPGPTRISAPDLISLSTRGSNTRATPSPCAAARSDGAHAVDLQTLGFVPAPLEAGRVEAERPSPSRSTSCRRARRGSAAPAPGRTAREASGGAPSAGAATGTAQSAMIFRPRRRANRRRRSAARHRPAPPPCRPCADWPRPATRSRDGRRRNWPSRGSSQCEAKIGTEETRSRRLPAVCRASARERSPKARPVVAASWRPAADSTTPRGPRSNSFSPSVRSRPAMRWLTAEAVMCSSSASRLERAGARRKLEGLQRQEVARREASSRGRRSVRTPRPAAPSRSPRPP